jgi:REP element-mobilizing transposase RayT
MPNHVHGIIVIETVEADHPSFVWATRPSADEIRDTNDILIDHMKDNLDGSPQQGVRATRSSADEIRDTHDIPIIDQMKENLDGSPRQGSPPQTRRPNGPRTNSLGAMIGQFKSLATKRIWALTEINRHPIWQRNYYEHIIRDDQEYRRIIQYIETNPLQWHDDPLHPSVPGILEGINHGR